MLNYYLVMLYHNNKKWPNQSWLGHSYVYAKTDWKRQGLNAAFIFNQTSLTMANLKALMNRLFDIKIEANGFLGDINDVIALD